MHLPKFTKINEPFVCHHCHRSVPKAEKTCRDHCPYCLYSLHVDENPGDRACQCKGVLKPESYSYNRKKGYMIQYRCQRCGSVKWNRFLEIDAFLPDSLDALLALNNIPN